MEHQPQTVSEARKAIADLKTRSDDQGITSPRLTKCYELIDEIVALVDAAPVQGHMDRPQQLMDQLLRTSVLDHLTQVTDEFFNAVHEVHTTKASRWMVDWTDTNEFDIEKGWETLLMEEDEVLLPLLALKAARVDTFGEPLDTKKEFNPAYNGVQLRSADGFPSWVLLKVICLGLPAALETPFE
ncbi:MAG: hypothetical protein E6R08_01085 [Nevskiaceae bacterium]|nr:MAG: hypothetical protein E6R08_01085 [Nevskiaceae bacterium]